MRFRTVFSAFLLALGARSVSAQSIVDITPPNGSFPEGNEIDITIVFCLTTQLYYYDHLIQLNGIDVTSDFSWNPGTYWGCDYYATASGPVSLAYAQNTVYARIRTWDGADVFVSNDNSVTLIGTDPLATHNGHNRNVAMCAFACFHNVVSYSTPAYWSHDTPRSVTLRYSSGQLGDLHTINVDVHNRSGNMPLYVLLRVQNASGAYVPFTNGTTYMYYSAVAGTHRLAAQLDTTLSSGAHRFTLVVTRQFGSGPVALSYPLRILSVNEQDSPYGAGWAIAGLPRIRTGPGDSLSVTDGFGSIAFWKRQSCSGSNPEICIYTPPPGAFDSLTRCSGALCSGNLSYGIRYIDGSRVNFDAAGRPEALIDPSLGHTTTIYWRDASRIDSIVDPAGKKIGIYYNGSSRLDSIVDAVGLRRTRFTVNGSNDLTHIVDAAGDTTLDSATYDSSHRLRYRRDRRGGDWRTSYDFAGYVARDSTPQVVIDSGGGSTVRLITLYRSPESSLLIDSSSSAGRTSGNLATPEPDSAGIARVTPPGTSEGIVRVDAYGAPLAVLAPAQSAALYTRNEHGQLVTAFDSLGSRVTYWDGPRDTLTSTTVGARTTSVIKSWNVTYHRITDIRGTGVAQRRLFYYGTGGRLDSTRVWNEPLTRFYYDSQGRDTLSVDTWSHTVRRRYQSSGLKNTDSVISGPNWSALARDAIGRPIVTTGPLNRRDSTAYDALNLMTFTSRALGDSMRYWYGSDLGLDSLRDALGNKYHFRRNAVGWDTLRIDPRGRTDSLRYDRAGRLARAVNRRGQVNVFSYNTFGQLLGRGQYQQATTDFTYSAVRTVASNGEGSDTVRMAGDTAYSISVRKNGALVFTVRSRDSVSTRVHRVAVTSSAGGGWYETRYTADSLGRLRTITPPSASTDSLFYNTEGGLARIWLHGVESIRHSYRPRHLLARDSFAVGRMDTASSREYIHDAYGRVVEARDSIRNRFEEFTYDVGGRLTAWTRRSTSAPCTATDTTSETGAACATGSSTIASQSFSYDVLGNNGTLHSGGGNRLASWGGYSFTYDSTGNLLTKYKSGVLDQSFMWNSFNELASVSTSVSGGGAVTTSFGYDAWGRRVRKSTGADTTYYVWDGNQVIAEYDDSGVLQRQFTYYGPDRPHSVLSGGARHYFASDGRGNVIGLLDSTASTVEARYRYTPFGDTAATSATVTNRVRFAGRELDTETGLYYNRARYYDPQVGRFISEDPIGLRGGPNVYTYANNDPIGFSDPSGLLVVTIGRCARAAIENLRNASSTFRQIYDALHSMPASDVYLVIKPQVTPEEIEYVRRAGDGRGYTHRNYQSAYGRIVYNDNCSGMEELIAHEIIHAAGMYADKLRQLVPGWCGQPHDLQRHNPEVQARCRSLEGAIWSDWEAYAERVLGSSRKDERDSARDDFIHFRNRLAY